MSYTFSSVAFRLLAFYFTILVIRSIYQAISPISAHNRGKNIDYGAEQIQQRFKDLQSVSPGFDYFVQTMYQVMAQTLLTVMIRYSINAAIVTGVFIAFALCSTLVTLGELLTLVVWLPIQLVMGSKLLIGKLVGRIEKVLSGELLVGESTGSRERAFPRMSEYPKFPARLKDSKGYGRQGATKSRQSRRDKRPA